MGKLVKFISLEDFKKILKTETKPEYKLCYVLAYGSGLRISEILGPHKNSNQEIKPLTADQIDLNTKQIRIFGKGGKERISVINPLFPIKENMLKLLPIKKSRTALQSRFSIISQKALGKKLNFHILRHGFGNHMANDRSIPLPMVQGFLGHSRLDTTGIYAHANPVQSINKVWEGF